ncbi:MAG TPA: hypothetical protein VKP64_09510 [Mycobacteriales bacterium]|nr:hypothetical protein [Mycobacteriales bacterium]
MRMSDLVGALVVDESGRPLGHVHDLRLVADGVTFPATGNRAYRVHGLVVGAGAVGMRLGYARGHVQGPWLLRVLLRRLRRRRREIPWEAVREVTPGRIVARVAAQ